MARPDVFNELKAIAVDQRHLVEDPDVQAVMYADMEKKVGQYVAAVMDDQSVSSRKEMPHVTGEGSVSEETPPTPQKNVEEESAMLREEW